MPSSPRLDDIYHRENLARIQTHTHTQTRGQLSYMRRGQCRSSTYRQRDPHPRARTNGGPTIPADRDTAQTSCAGVSGTIPENSDLPIYVSSRTRKDGARRLTPLSALVLAPVAPSLVLLRDVLPRLHLIRRAQFRDLLASSQISRPRPPNNSETNSPVGR